jgi:hypothetical protein
MGAIDVASESQAERALWDANYRVEPAARATSAAPETLARACLW